MRSDTATGGLEPLGRDLPPTASQEQSMTRITLTTLALILSSACAHAQDWSASAFLPPAEFEHPYPGELVIRRLKTENDVRLACLAGNFTTGRAMGCNLRWGM